MRVTRSIAGLLLLALIVSAQAIRDKKCANCGLGEGEDSCNCGNLAVRARKLEKFEHFASPTAIKNAIKRRSKLKSPVATINTPPKAAYQQPSSYQSYYDVAPAPSPVSYNPPPPPTPSPPIRSKSYVRTRCRNNTGVYGNGIRHTKDSEDLMKLLSLDPDTPVAPKFEPIGDLCFSCDKHEGKQVIGVVPAVPGKLPCGPVEPEPEPSTTPSPPVTYPTPAATYPTPAPTYNAPTPSYAPSAPYYSAPVANSVQYAAAYQTPVPASYSPSSPTASYSPPLISETIPSTTPEPKRYASAYPQSAPVIYVVGGSPPPSADQSKAPSDYQKLEKEDKTVSEPKDQYVLAYEQENKDTAPNAEKKCSCKKCQASEPKDQYIVAYEQDSKDTVADKKKKCSCKKCQAQNKDEKDVQTIQTYVEIEVQEEPEPVHIADPVSVSMAYKILADSQGKKHVPEDSLAYGHHKEPVDGRICKHLSDFDEEKLHTLDKPVVELKSNSDYQNLQVSYDDIGYGPVAPSKNRFVTKTDDTNKSPYGPIIYVPPPEDKDGLPCGPLGPTIPGYKPGGVIIGDSNEKTTCGRCGKSTIVQEGSRQAVLVGCKCQKNEDSREREGGIIERIKSLSCSSKHSEYK